MRKLYSWYLRLTAQPRNSSGNPKSNMIKTMLSDHRVLFPLSLLIFYCFPYIIQLFSISYSRFIIPNVWMWGLVLFAIGIYLMSINVVGEFFHNRILVKYQKPLRFIILGAILALVWHLMTFFDFDLFLRLIFSFGGVGCIHLLFASSFTERLSVLLIGLSLGLMLLGFLILGGIPLFHEDLRIIAKLSLLREIAVPLFLIGAVSASLGFRTGKKNWRHIMPLIFFGAGASIFALNGKRLDLLVIGVVYGLYFIRTYSARRVLPIVLAFIGFGFAIMLFYPTGTLRLIRQYFNFQVLRHLIFYVATPITGVTHGTIILGLKREFIGPTLIYGELGEWVLTATWLGPLYMDFGLLGVLISMAGLALLLHSLQKKANSREGHKKYEILYIVALGRVLVLFEEGIDLPIVIFLGVIAYGLLMEDHFSGLDHGSEMNRLNRISSLNLTAIITLLLIGLTMIFWAFDAEFRQSQIRFQQNISTTQDEIAFNCSLSSKYYHLELLSSNMAAFLDGNLKVLNFKILIQEFKIDGAFWLANKDRISIGWFKPPEPGLYTFVLSGNFLSYDMITMSIKDAPLSFLLPTYRFVQLGVLFVFISELLLLLTRLEIKK